MSDLVDPAPRRPLTPREKWIVWALIVGFTALVAIDLARTADIALWTVALMLVAWVPLLVLHELGHALAARAVGWHVHRLVIGFGRDVTRFRFGKTRVVFRQFPATGFVEPVPTDLSWPRLKNAFVYFAGPGIELLLIGMLVLAIGPERYFEGTNDVGLLALQSLGAAAALGAFSNLIPFRASNGSASDGLGMLMSIALPVEHFADRRSAAVLGDARAFLERGQPGRALELIDDGLQRWPDDVPLRVEKTVCLAALGERESAVDVLNSIGDPNDHSPSRRVALWHARGRIALELERDLALLRDGHLACEAALEIAPAHGPLEVTLGAILVERNRIEEARMMLERGHAGADEHDAARALAYLAIAAHRAGDRQAAQSYRSALSERRPVNQRLVDRMERELGSA